MARKLTGNSVGRPYELRPRPTKDADKVAQWRLDNLEKSRADALARYYARRARGN